MFFLLLQRGRFRESVQFAIHTDAVVAVGSELGEQVDELALPGADDRCQHLEAGTLLPLEDLVDDLLGGLTGDHLAARGAVGNPCPGI